MANNKKSSTSKTARVMNLLSKNRDEAAETELTAAQEPEAAEPAPAAPAPVAAPASAAEPAPAPAAAPVPHSSTPPIISSMQADSAISEQVYSALESALEDELGAAISAASEPEVKAEPAPAAVSAPVSEPPAPAVAPVPETPTVSMEVGAELDDQPHPPTRFSVDPATSYVNVMEALVEEKAKKYIDMFGLCKCPRCVADVKALTLNRIDPKYVVMKTGDVIPRITLYEGQFSAAVTAHLLSACKIVMEHPRHDRE